jgi:Na+/H+ antiporter NhaD/arsenite permease-like protein
MHSMASFWTVSPRSLEILAAVLACLALAVTGLRSLKTASTHEDLSRDHAIKGPSDRSFGLVMTGFFLLVGLAPLRHHLPLRLWALGVAVIFLLVSLLWPHVLAPLNKAWMLLGRLLSRIMAPVVTGLLFYLVFTPAGFFYRLLGKDSLRLKPGKDSRSYWIERKPPGPPPEEMINQF